MVAELALLTSIVLSSTFPGVDGYLGDDMNDEDFALFVDTHYDMIEPVVEFVKSHKDSFPRGVSGLAGSLVAARLPLGPALKLFIGAGSSEVGKNIYDEFSGSNSEKDQRIRSLEQKQEHTEKLLMDALKEIKEIKEKIGDPVEDEQSLLQFNDCRGGVDGSYRQEHSSYRDTERRQHMTENSHHARDNFHRTPSERRREKMHPEERHERETLERHGLGGGDRAMASDRREKNTRPS